MRLATLAALLAPSLAAADHVVIQPPPPPPLPPPGPVVIATTPTPPPVAPVQIVEPRTPAPSEPGTAWMLAPISRLQLASIPELAMLEPALPLDRGVPHELRRHGLVFGQAALGAGRRGSETGSAYELALAGGWSDRNVLVGARSELSAFQDALVRGHHALVLHADNLAEDRRGPSGGLDISAVLDHGESRGLAPIALGSGRRDNGEVTAEALLRISEDRSDGAWVVGVQGGLGQTRWEDAVLQRAQRQSFGMSLGMSPADGELPRGTFDLVRARIEQATIGRRATALGSSLDSTVRLVELGAGPRQLTLHVDHELAGVVDCDVGWVWLSSDTPAGTLADDMFRMKLATHLAWRDETSGRRRRFGLAVEREPTYTPDGERLVSDWRLQLVTGVEDGRARLDARGGVSWVTPMASAGNDAADSTLTRYGVQLEAGFKLASSFELGAYHSQWYEPQMAGDPWRSSRAWTVESGVLARLRTN